MNADIENDFELDYLICLGIFSFKIQNKTYSFIEIYGHSIEVVL